MPENRHKCSRSNLLGMFYKHLWSKPAKKQPFSSHLNFGADSVFRKWDILTALKGQSPLAGMTTPSVRPVLYLIFSQRNDRHLGECGQGKWCASSKERGFFLEWACCPEARLICILSAVHLSFTCKAAALPASAWIQPCPREGLRPWTSNAI